jgi:UDP-N-acetylmuramoyl-L-alanyl-D-glutamate--2,6-diaminopimelate ligase
MLGFGTIPAAETRAERIEMTPTGSRFHMTSPKGAIDITTTLPGPFNISNCLAAAAVSLQSGIGLEAIEAGIADLQAVPGRFEAVGCGQPFAVIVDYAHTPDSLENILVAARRMAAPSDGSLVCVFGCGGDRDRAKRPLMGAAVARLADRVIVTSDNPRSEEPAAILDEIVEGVIATRAQGPDVVEVDRRVAIETAITEAREGDVVVIAGKGHETGQEFADRTVPFDDREVAAEVLAGQGWVADR